MIRHQGASAIVVAVDLEALKAEAERSKGIVEFVPQIGDFVAIDDPLFNLYSGACSVDEHVLRSSVAFGSERAMDQDPTFAFRIVVDVALKALSPAINDPTTAVLAMDQLHRMLRTVGNARPAHGRIAGSIRATSRDFPDTKLGRFCVSRLQRDPQLRLEQSPGREADAGDD